MTTELMFFTVIFRGTPKCTSHHEFCETCTKENAAPEKTAEEAFTKTTLLTANDSERKLFILRNVLPRSKNINPRVFEIISKLTTLQALPKLGL